MARAPWAVGRQTRSFLAEPRFCVPRTACDGNDHCTVLEPPLERGYGYFLESHERCCTMADHFGPLSEIRVFARNRSAQLPGGRSADQNGPQTAVQGLSEQAAIASFQPATNLLQCPLKQQIPLL